MMRSLILVALLGLAGALTATGPARAQVPADVVRAEVIAGWRLASGDHMAGLRLTMAPGWHTYWRAPGDAGIPPSFEWRGSDNLASVEIAWPTPQMFDQSGLRAIGYDNQVVIPLRLRPQRAGAPMQLAGRVNLGVCREICVPQSLTFDAALPAGQTGPDPHIAAALADRPLSAAEAGIGAVSCTIEPREGGLRLTARIALPAPGDVEAAVIETANPQIWVAQPRTRRDGAVLVAQADMAHVDGEAIVLDRSGLRITLLGARQAVDIRGCPAG